MESELSLCQFLESAGLAHLTECMLVEGVTIEILKEANDAELSQLTEKLADKIRLRSALEKFKLQESSNKSSDFYSAGPLVALPVRQHKVLKPSETFESLNVDTSSTQEKINFDTSLNPVTIESLNVDTSSTQEKINFDTSLNPVTIEDYSFPFELGTDFEFRKDIDASSIEDNSKSQLHSLLTKQTKGKLLIEKAQKGLALTSRDRCYIVSLIVELELQLLQRLNQSIRKHVWENWSTEIASLFKGESKEVYYVPYHVVDGKVIQASGLIHNRLITHRRNLTLEGPKKRGADSDSTDSGCSSKSSASELHKRIRPLPEEHKESEQLYSQQNLDWLRGTSYPQVTLKSKWQSTFDARMKILKQISFVEYFNTFPGLTLPNGHELLTSDFQAVYPTENNKFEESFPLVKLKLLKLLTEKAESNKSDDTIIELLDLASAGEEQANVAALLGIVALLRQMHTITVPKKKIWRLTRDETRNSFLARVATASDVAIFCTQREAFNASKGIPNQPYILAVGPSWTDLHMYEIVTTAGPRYQVSTVCEAIKLIYNLYWALDCAYPKASFPCWMFIQRAMFGMKSKFDVEGVPLRELLSQLNSI